MSDTFSRQRGLVNQDRVESLKVTFFDEESIPFAYKEAMVQIAEQLGVQDFPCPSNCSEFGLTWAHKPFEIDSKQDASMIFVAYGSDGIFLDGTACPNKAHPIFEPSLATIAACLTWSEILRRGNCYTPVDVPKVSVSVNVRVNEPSMKRIIQHFDFQLEGINSNPNIRPIDDGTGHMRILMRLDDDTPLVKELLKNLQVSVSVNVRVNEPSMKGSIQHLDFQLEGINSTINIRPVGDGNGHKRVLMRLDDDTPLVKELLKKLQVSVDVRMNEPSTRGSIQHLDFQLEGINSNINIRPVDDGTGHKRVLMRLDDDALLVQELLKKLRVTGGDENNHPMYPSMRFTLPDPQTTPAGHLTVVGAGGLGTWALHSIVNGLKDLDFDDIHLFVFDKDMEVEQHNLNRQVIFSESDIGRPKIEAAKDWLRRNLPSAKISIAYELHDGLLQPLESSLEVNDEEGFSLDDLLEDSHQPLDSQYDILNDSEVRNQLEQTDAILGCLDAMRPRVLADLIAARKGQPYVNGGIVGLFAQYTEFSNTNLVEYYGPSVARDQVVYSCQEDGEVPISSLAITNAFVGSLQAIAALQRLTGQKYASIGSVNWNARYNEVYCNLSEGEIIRMNGVKLLEKALWSAQLPSSSIQLETIKVDSE